MVIKKSTSPTKTHGGSRAGAGRPVGTGRGASEVFQMRLTPIERAAWTAAAEAADLSLAAWLRGLANAAIGVR